MILDIPDDLTVTTEEKALGFSVQTLDYPAGPLELSGLAAGATAYERAVAFQIDERTRIRRCRTGAGYVCERFNGNTWGMFEEFETLQAVAESQVYLRYTQSSSQESPGDTFDNE